MVEDGRDSSRTQGVSRRTALAAAVGGAVAALAPGSAAGRAAAAPGPNAAQFFSDPSLNFQALFALSAAAYGASAPGEVLEVFNRVHARGDTYRAYYEEFLAEGLRLKDLGDRAARSRRRVTARDSYLRAATYLDQALYFVLASSSPSRAQEGRVYREMEACFAAAVTRLDPPAERVSIPYERRRPLPGWLLMPPGPRVRRPTLILNNGSDAQNVDFIPTMGLATLGRGWNALIFEGPGQGSNLFLHNMPFRPDWENVVRPIVSWLRRRPEVDPRRISLFGTSFGGYLVPRAAAFEHRLAAVAVDPGVTDAFVSWSGHLPAQLLTLLRQRRRDAFDRLWAESQPFLTATERFDIAKRAEIYGAVSFYDQMQLAQRFVLTPEVARRVSAPAIIVQAELEDFFPGQSKVLNDWMRAKRSLVTFTVAEGAQYHCEPMAPALRNDVVLDWLEANLRPTR